MRSSLLALAGVAFLGCSESSAVPDVVVTDSAGIVVVWNGPERLVTVDRWELGSSALLSIRSSDEATLFQVIDISRTESGAIAVVNSGNDEVLLFDGQGAFLGRRGREGDGPGEFRRLSTVLPLGGDSIGAYDYGHKRLTIFDPGGAVVREVTLGPVEGGSEFEKLFLRANGEVAVFTQAGLRGGSPGVFRTLSESYAIDRTGVRTGSFGRFEGAELFIGEAGAGRVPFGANTHAATVGDELVVGTAAEAEVRFHTDDGRLRRIVRWPDGDRNVTDERVAQYRAALEATVPEAALAQVRAMLAAVPMGDRQPAFENLLASPNGEIWVGSYRGPEMSIPGARSPARDWLVFDETGTLVATVSTPLGFQPLLVGRSDVIGVSTDEFSVESIDVYEVHHLAPQQPTPEHPDTAR